MMPAQRVSFHWSLSRLLAGFANVTGLPELEVLGLSLDSREVRPGSLFLAYQGTRCHGLRYARQAQKQGAIAIVAEPSNEWTAARIAALAAQLRIPIILAVSLKTNASRLAARFFGNPAEQLRMVGITGTNGKTSVSQFLAQALNKDWHCGILGTLGYGFPGSLEVASHTTPDAVRLQQLLSDLAQAGARAIAMEVSSHALDQGRVAAVPFHTAVFTNLTRDHLDYHGDMLSYAAAKATLFRAAGLSLAVFNTDDATGRRLISEASQAVTRVAVGRDAAGLSGASKFVQIDNIATGAYGLTFEFSSSWGPGAVQVKVLGSFNVENLALTLAVLLAWDVGVAEAVQRLQNLVAVPGRMETFGGASQPLVVVDYAHTPDALRKALQALRIHVRGALVCVFGCGGDRDSGKRPEMGAAAEREADRVILTDDNPRSEDAERIIDAIQSGMANPNQSQVERRRARAIRMAIASASSGDVILIAGKGHEEYQEVGDMRLPFSDAAEVRRALELNGDA